MRGDRKITLLIISALILGWGLPVLATTPSEMAKYLPDKVGEYQAQAPAGEEQMPFPGFLAASRTYKTNGQPIKVTTYHLTGKSNVSYKVAEDVDIKGLPGRMRILRDKKLVGLLVDLKDEKTGGKTKIVVSVLQKGTTDPAVLLDFARKFDYQGLINLQ